MVDLDELVERLEKANKSLVALAEFEADSARNSKYHLTQLHVDRYRHLTSKAEGVRLALSYLEEARRIDEQD